MEVLFTSSTPQAGKHTFEKFRSLFFLINAIIRGSRSTSIFNRSARISGATPLYLPLVNILTCLEKSYRIFLRWHYSASTFPLPELFYFPFLSSLKENGTDFLKIVFVVTGWNSQNSSQLFHRHLIHSKLN